jgi:hypothetical protein
MEPASDPRPRSHGWIGCAVAAFLLVVLLAIAVPGLLSSSRASNDRNASSTLKTLSTAEADFRANDRDWNRVNDFWTGDVKGLYTLTSSQMPGAKPGDTFDPSIKLIEISVAGADVDPALVSAGGENLGLEHFTVPSPKAGYWYAALTRDLSESPAEAVYRTDTGGTPPMGKCHSFSKFGFVTFPDTVKAGKAAYMVNEGNIIYQTPVKSAIRRGTAVPPGLNGFDPAFQNWPDPRAFGEAWRKLD